MLELSHVEGNVVVVCPDGKVTGEDIDRVVADTESMLAEYEEIGVVADMTKLQGMTAEAIAKDFAAEFRFFGDWKRFPRIAVVAEPGWLDTMARTVGAVLPRNEVRTFTPDQRANALAFASSVRPDRVER